MATLRQPRVILRAGAGRKGGTIQLALKIPYLRRSEAEAGTVAGAWIARSCRDRRVRRNAVNRPRVVCRGRIDVARQIDSLYLKIVVTLTQSGVILWARAGRKAGAIQLALKTAWLS